MTTKVHTLADALGNPVRFILTGGNEADCTQALPLLTGIQTGAVLGDKGYDTDAIVEGVIRASALAVIPPKADRKVKRDCDYALYKERNLIERFFNRIKHYRAIATRYAKRARNFKAFLYIAATVIWMA
ncbi:transposase (fragment) [Candidatus Terasakiella magnetica]